MTNYIKLAMEERYGQPDLSPEALMQQVEAACSRQVKQRRIWMTGLCGLVLAVSLGGFAAFQIEAAEYREASGYLEKYGIDVEDMSRGVVKQVYKDIITSTFELDSTKAILQNLSVQMDILLPQRPTETELQAFWNKYQLDWEKRLEPAAMRLDIQGDRVSGRRFVKYVDDEKVWEYHDTEKYLNGLNVYFEQLDDGNLFYTTTDSSNSSNTDIQAELRLMLLDNDGNLVWSGAVDFAEKEPHINAIFEKDGRLDIIGHSTRFGGASTDKYEYFLLTCDTETGELVQDERTAAEEYMSIYKVVDLGGQYLILSDKQVVTLSYDGVIGQFSQFESNGKNYSICDVMSVGDKFYISAESENMDDEAFMKVIQECELAYNLDAEHVVDMVENQTEFTPQQQEGLKEIARLINERKNAVLLVLDEGFQVERVVETPYSAAGKLKTEDGRILQEISQVESANVNNQYSSWPGYDVERMVYQYTFDLDGNFIEQEALGIQHNRL